MGDKIATVVALFVWVTGFATVGARAQQAILPPDSFFDANGVRLRYVDQGQGPPVLLIHGYTGTLDRHWIDSGVFTNLVRDYRVIALDCRGHGKSDKPVDPKRYGAEMSQDIARLLDHLKIPRAHVVGFSMGAIIAGHLLTTNPDRFITATFVGYHPVYKWSADDEREAEASARDLEGDTPFRSLILGISPPDARPSEEEIRKLSQRLAAANDTKALAAYHRGRRGLTVTETQIATVRVPTLGVIGSADPSIEGVQELKRIMPALKVITVEGAEHGGQRGILRRPEFLAVLRDFFSDQRPTPRRREEQPGRRYRTSVGFSGRTTSGQLLVSQTSVWWKQSRRRDPPREALATNSLSRSEISALGHCPYADIPKHHTGIRSVAAELPAPTLR